MKVKDTIDLWMYERKNVRVKLKTGEVKEFFVHEWDEYPHMDKDRSDEDMILQIENGIRHWIFAHEIEKIEEIVKESNPGD